MNQLLRITLLALFVMGSGMAYTQIERKKVAKTCKDCRWKSYSTYMYEKPNGNVIFNSELRAHWESKPVENTILLYEQDNNFTNAVVLLNVATNEYLIDVRGRNGKIERKFIWINAKFSASGKDEKLGKFYTVYYDGGSVVVDSSLNVIIPYAKGQEIIYNDETTDYRTKETSPGMRSAKSWAFMTYPGKVKYTIEGKIAEKEMPTAEVVQEFEAGYTYRKDNYIYSNNGTPIVKMYFKPYKWKYIKELNRLFVFTDVDGRGYLIDTQNEKMLLETIFRTTDPQVRQEKFMVLRVDNEYTVLNLETGIRCPNNYSRIEIINGKLMTNTAGKEIDSEIDPNTCTIKMTGIDNENYSAVDIDFIGSNFDYSDQALCLDHNGNYLRAVNNNSDAVLDIRRYLHPVESSYKTSYFNSNSEPHRIISLQNKGILVGGRNFFGFRNEDFSLYKSTGSKMEDWRATSQSPDDMTYFMDTWKQNKTGTGTSIDFLDVAENTTGTMGASVFLYHQWTNGVPKMRLGLCIRGLTDPYVLKFHDLNMEVESDNDIKCAADVAQRVKMIFLDERNILIGFCGSSDNKNYQATIINIDKIVNGEPLDAQVWQGNFHETPSQERAMGGLLLENGIIYYTFSVSESEGAFIYLGKAKWNGSKMEIIQSRKLKSGYNDLGEVHVMAKLNSGSFILAGSSLSSISGYSYQPVMLRFSFDNLSNTNGILLRGDNYYEPRVLDIVSFQPTANENKFAILFRGKSKDKGGFYMKEIVFKK